MKTSKQILISIFLVLANVASSADQISGRELLAFCESAVGSPEKRYCEGYITAAIETHAVWVLWRQMDRILCFPKGDKFEHAYGATLAYLKTNKDQLDYEASSIVLNALNQSFACE